MKKTLVLLSIITICFNLSFAQEHHIGLNTGHGIASRIKVDERYYLASYQSVFYKPIYSYSINAVYALKLKKIKLSVEPGYLLKGTKYGTNYQIENYDYSDLPKIKLHYINIPVLFSYYITKNFQISLGPEVAYHLSTVVTDYREKRIYDENAYELFGNIGVYYQLRKNLDIGLRFSIKIPPTNDKYYHLDYYTHFILQYRINLSKKKDKAK